MQYNIFIVNFTGCKSEDWWVGGARSRGRRGEPGNLLKKNEQREM